MTAPNVQKIIVQNQRSFPILGVLGLIFVTLKLTGFIAWSWWWVTSPFWIPLAIVLGFMAGALCLALVCGIIVLVIDLLDK